MKRLALVTTAFLMAAPVMGSTSGTAGGVPISKGVPLSLAKDSETNAAQAQNSFRLAKEDGEKVRIAPDFAAKDAHDKVVKLADFKGKWVVLEWTNPECPFVKKQYSSGNMQKLQKEYTAKGVVWLSVHSSAMGKEGYLDSKGILAEVAKSGAAPTASLQDEDGKIGKAYEATATPHMFIINPKQEIVYSGAIDDSKTTNVKDIPNSKNYVSTVLDAVLDPKVGEKGITVSRTKAVGCSIKYK